MTYPCRGCDGTCCTGVSGYPCTCEPPRDEEAGRTPGPVLAAVLARLAARGLESVQVDGYWVARCPSHNDRRPSLTLCQTRAGAHINCHAGCTADEVLGALDLKLADLLEKDKD